MGWALVFIGLLFAPIVWAFTKGRDAFPGPHGDLSGGGGAGGGEQLA